MDWYIKRLERRDSGAFLKFLSNWIKDVPVELRYQWLYENNPHGKALTWLAINNKNNEIIGCTSIFPKKVWFKDRITLGSVGGDAYVNPNYRRTGIATELHRAALNEMGDAGIKFMYGFPVPHNFAAFMKIGAFNPGEFKMIKLPLRSESFLKKLQLNGWVLTSLSNFADRFLNLYVNSKLSKVANIKHNLEAISTFDSRFDQLMNDIIPSFNICFVRDSEYLRWRFLETLYRKPNILSYSENGDLHGYAAIEIVDKECNLTDFFVRRDDDIAKSFICSIVKFAYLNGSKLIRLMINTKGPYYHNFLKCGFRFGLHSSGLPLMILMKKNDKNNNYVNYLGNWYIAYEDGDIQKYSIMRVEKRYHAEEENQWQLGCIDIFAITEEGETKRLLEPFQNAFVANPKSIEEIQTK